MRSGAPSSELLQTPTAKPTTPGGPGSQWRMMRLRRVYEAAEEDGVPVEELAIERFGSLEAFEEAKEERRVLDEREGRRNERDRGRDVKGKGREGEKGFMFTDIAGSGASSRSSSFRRPTNIGNTTPSTPSPPTQASNRRLDSLRMPSQAGSPLAQSHTPIPSVMTPPPYITSSSKRALSPSSLNKLQAKVLRAKLMGSADADKLEKEYDEAMQNANGGGQGSSERSDVRTKVQVLPTLDGQGRLYDVGSGKADDPSLPGNRKKKEKVGYTWTVSSSYVLILLCSISKLETPKQETWCAIMLTMIQLPLEICCGMRSLAVAWPIKKVWMPSLRKRLWAMGNSRSVLNQSRG